MACPKRHKIFGHLPGFINVKGMVQRYTNKRITGWWLTYPSEKYEFVSWDDYSNYWGNKTCSKPPTRLYIYIYITLWLLNIAMENHHFLIGTSSINGSFSSSQTVSHNQRVLNIRPILWAWSHIFEPQPYSGWWL